MSQVKLSRLFSKRKAATSLITDLMAAMDAPVSVQDQKGKHLLGAAASIELPHPERSEGTGDGGAQREPITHEGQTLGWVVGNNSNRHLIAALVSHLVNKEAEKKALAVEVLDRYRELNLLYNLSEKLATCLELEAVAQTAIDEAHRLIQTTGGALLLLNKERNTLDPLVSFGSDAPTSLKLGAGIAGKVAQRGKAEIVNDVPADPRSTWHEKRAHSLLCVPLKAKNHVIGVILLHHASPIIYTAGHLKLLNTLASQAAPAIENALLYEKTIRNAKEREARLQQQIQDLRIELDEARQEKQVAEITESDYFQNLRSQAANLRQIMAGID